MNVILDKIKGPSAFCTHKYRCYRYLLHSQELLLLNYFYLVFKYIFVFNKPFLRQMKRFNLNLIKNRHYIRPKGSNQINSVTSI